MTQELHWNTPLISRQPGRHRPVLRRVHAGRDQPGRPAQWRPDLDDPLRERRGDDGDVEPVLRLPVPEPPGDNQGAAWHLCGVGVKN